MNPTSKIGQAEKSLTEDNNGKTCSFDVCGTCKFICCQDAKPPLSENRKKILKEYIKKEKIPVEEPFMREGYSYPAIDETKLCKLFNKQTRRCSVHPVKPETCRAGPVTWDINFNTKKLEYYLKLEKICPLAGVLYKNPPVLAEHLDAAKVEIRQLVEDLSADELKVIVKIPEPDTFKICEENLSASVIKKLGLN
jgi:Fe-S-cluster containining protein